MRLTNLGHSEYAERATALIQAPGDQGCAPRYAYSSMLSKRYNPALG